jgi:hypothetical protein
LKSGIKCSTPVDGLSSLMARTVVAYSRARLAEVFESRPEVLTHNVETVASHLQTDPAPGRAGYLRKRSAGKSHREALRCLKRHLSNDVYRQLVHDAATLEGRARRDTWGRLSCPAWPAHTPFAGTSDQSLTRPSQPPPYIRRPVRAIRSGAPAPTWQPTAATPFARCPRHQWFLVHAAPIQQTRR